MGSISAGAVGDVGFNDYGPGCHRGGFPGYVCTQPDKTVAMNVYQIRRLGSLLFDVLHIVVLVLRVRKFRKWLYIALAAWGLWKSDVGSWSTVAVDSLKGLFQ